MLSTRYCKGSSAFRGGLLQHRILILPNALTCVITHESFSSALCLLLASYYLSLPEIYKKVVLLQLPIPSFEISPSQTSTNQIFTSTSKLIPKRPQAQTPSLLNPPKCSTKPSSASSPSPSPQPPFPIPPPLPAPPAQPAMHPAPSPAATRSARTAPVSAASSQVRTEETRSPCTEFQLTHSISIEHPQPNLHFGHVFGVLQRHSG